MNRIINVFEQIRTSSSTNIKKDILSEYKNDEQVKYYLEYLLNPHKVTGINKSKLSKKLSVEGKSSTDTSLSDILEYLLVNNTGNDIVVSRIQSYLSSLECDVERKFSEQMITKSYKLGVKAKLVNASIPNLIPEFNVMLAESYEKNMNYVNGKDFILTLKLDGCRCVMIKDDNDIKCFSRQGKAIDFLTQISDDMSKLPNGVYDGELIATGMFKSSKDQFKQTMKLSRIKGEKIGLKFVVFDYIENISDFNNNTSTMTCIDRKELVKSHISKVELEYVEYLEPYYIGNDITKIQHYSDIATSHDEEGIMLNIADSKYECKRSKNILKVKVFKTCDILCTGVEEGEGKLEGTLGKIVCDYKGFKLRVGSGFDDTTRNHLWNNPSEVIGRVVEVKYFEELETDGKLSVRYPVFIAVREEGKEVSYH